LKYGDCHLLPDQALLFSFPIEKKHTIDEKDDGDLSENGPFQNIYILP
jgi:hypothetical protein